MNKTAIVACDCTNKYQDRVYGAGRRVTTPNNVQQAKGFLVVRCTVCAKEHNLGGIK